MFWSWKLYLFEFVINRVCLKVSNFGFENVTSNYLLSFIFMVTFMLSPAEKLAY